MDEKQKKAVAARLAKIAALHAGTLTPESVVEDARSAKSPLHDHFTWDDSEASAKWRLEEARQLIRSVRVDITVESRTVSTVRYVRDPSAGPEQGYIETAKLRTDKALALEALRSEMRATQARFERAESLAEALDLKHEFQKLRQHVADFDGNLEEQQAA